MSLELEFTRRAGVGTCIRRSLALVSEASLRTKAGMTIDEVAALLKSSRRTAYRYLAVLVDMHKIERVGDKGPGNQVLYRWVNE